jgi:isoleucyl-tRNA synthetase
MSDDCPDDIELHKPYVDNVHIKCPDCGKNMTRVPEVIDCWFDSGSMPFAQYHYPFENKEFFDSHYPCNFISEGIDQTRGWFYSLIAISTVLFGRAPFENCIVMGIVQDKDGIKMSKHLGNVVDPWDVLDAQGADAARWYFYTANQPWLPSRFSMEAVNDGIKKFIGTYWNTYAFYVMYADIDNFDPTKHTLSKDGLCAMDRWILSRLNSLIKDVRARMDAYDISMSARQIQDFTEELSNWYVRRCRDRYWGAEETQDKIDAYMTLYTVLEQLTKLSAPFVPFITEEVYQNIVRSVDSDAPVSVHLCLYPECDESRIDKELEASMELVQKIVFLGRSCREQANIKNRQPLSDIFVVSDEKLDDEYSDIILDELNIRNIKVLEDSSSLVDYSFKPQLRTCGRKFGKNLNAAKEVIAALPGKETYEALKAGSVKITVEGEEYEMTEEDFLIETKQPEGFSTQTDKGLTVSISTVLTEELIEAGFVRELISKIQTQRKETGLEVTDRIILGYDGNDKLAAIIAKNSEFLASEVLASEVRAGLGANTKEWSVNGEKITVSVDKL